MVTMVTSVCPGAGSVPGSILLCGCSHPPVEGMIKLCSKPSRYFKVGQTCWGLFLQNPFKDGCRDASDQQREL